MIVSITIWAGSIMPNLHRMKDVNAIPFSQSHPVIFIVNEGLYS